MSPAIPDYGEIEARLARDGLLARGGFLPDGAGDRDFPRLAGDRPTAAIVMVGNAGPDMWESFARSQEHNERQPHALDRWSRRVLSRAARELGAEARFPFEGPPYLPFLAWAKRAEAVFTSPLGMLIHPDYGLWHAYRGALLFADAPSGLPHKAERAHPCESCRGRPCLSACPVDAFDGAERGAVKPADYDVAACKGHIGAPEGRDCLSQGCAARRACPVGPAWRYEPAQAEWHMRAFLGASGSRARMAGS